MQKYPRKKYKNTKSNCLAKEVFEISSAYFKEKQPLCKAKIVRQLCTTTSLELIPSHSYDKSIAYKIKDL